jgi:hypothetical protein
MNKYMAYALASITAVIIVFAANYYVKTTTDKYKPGKNSYSIVWYDTRIEVLFNDGYTDTFNLQVYDRPDNFFLEKGDLSYWKPSGATGGAVAGKTTIGSFVITYKVLSSEKRQIPEPK